MDSVQEIIRRDRSLYRGNLAPEREQVTLSVQRRFD